MSTFQFFVQEEIGSIIARRRNFEFSLHRNNVTRDEYIRYVEYEVNLDKLRKMRVLGKKEKKFFKSNLSGTNHTVYIFERAVRRFPSDMGLWEMYLDFLSSHKSRDKQVGEVLARMLQLHPSLPHLWTQAASHEFSANNSMEGCRAIFQRGLRENRGSGELWREYLSHELAIAIKLWEREEFLLASEEEKKEDSFSFLGVPLVVCEECINAFPEREDFVFELLQMVIEADSSSSLSFSPLIQFISSSLHQMDSPLSSLLSLILDKGGVETASNVTFNNRTPSLDPLIEVGEEDVRCEGKELEWKGEFISLLIGVASNPLKIISENQDCLEGSKKLQSVWIVEMSRRGEVDEERLTELVEKRCFLALLEAVERIPDFVERRVPQSQFESIFKSCEESERIKILRRMEGKREDGFFGELLGRFEESLCHLKEVRAMVVRRLGGKETIEISNDLLLGSGEKRGRELFEGKEEENVGGRRMRFEKLVRNFPKDAHIWSAFIEFEEEVGEGRNAMEVRWRMNKLINNNK